MQEGGERSEGVEESKYSSFGRFRFGFGRITFFRGCLFLFGCISFLGLRIFLLLRGSLLPSGGSYFFLSIPTSTSFPFGLCERDHSLSYFVEQMTLASVLPRGGLRRGGAEDQTRGIVSDFFEQDFEEPAGNDGDLDSRAVALKCPTTDAQSFGHVTTGQRRLEVLVQFRGF